MVRKVPNISAWVLKESDVEWFLPTSAIHVGFVYSTKLPLFSTTPLIMKYRKCHYEDDELILLIDGYERYEYSIVFETELIRGFTLEEVEEINKTWNKFYEDKNKET